MPKNFSLDFFASISLQNNLKQTKINLNLLLYTFNVHTTHV